MTTSRDDGELAHRIERFGIDRCRSQLSRRTASLTAVHAGERELMRREQLVERTMEFEVQTRIGPARAVAYKTRFEDAEHIALVFGPLGDSVPVRIHREKLLDDLDL